MSENLRFIKIVFYTQLGVLILLSTSVNASDQFIRFEGKMIEPATCQFNAGVATEVSFGSEIISRKIDGVNYVQEFTVYAVCEGNVTNNLRMRFFGGSPGFDTKVVGLTKNDIGVAIYNGSTQIGVNEWFNFTAPQTFKFKAILVKNPDTVISGGSFSGYVNMLADYR